MHPSASIAPHIPLAGHQRPHQEFHLGKPARQRVLARFIVSSFPAQNIKPTTNQHI